MNQQRSCDDRKIPAGFSVLVDTPEEFQLVIRATPIIYTLFLCLIFALFLGASLDIAITNSGEVRQLLSGWLPIIPFACGLFAILHFTHDLLFRLFGRTIVRATAEQVTVSHQLFGLNRTILIARSGISYLEESSDGDEEDCATSWSLRIMGRRKCWLLTGQPLERTRWLGRQLADFLDVTFRVWEEPFQRKR